MTKSAWAAFAVPIKVLLVLLSLFIFYLFAISGWYWDCHAQIDPSSLAAKCPSRPGGGDARLRAPKDNATVEERLWPNFGRGNDTYADGSQFWGDDIVSKLFERVFKVMADSIGPTIKNTLVPQWNRAMEPAFVRATLFGVVVWLLGAVGSEAIKDLYKILKERSA